MNMRQPLSPLWWLWLPLCFMVIQLIAEASLPREFLSVLHSEGGPHETLQFLIMAVSFCIASFGVFQFLKEGKKTLALWFVLAAISCLYVAGEEVSWGQHIFDWGTPDFWQGVNDQQETNLHNTSSWLDQKPRLILEIGIIVGGLLIPLIQKFRLSALPQQFSSIYPPPYLFVVALIVVGPKIIEKVGEAFGYSIFARVSEVQELAMFYFVLLYLMAIRKRNRST